MLSHKSTLPQTHASKTYYFHPTRIDEHHLQTARTSARALSHANTLRDIFTLEIHITYANKSLTNKTHIGEPYLPRCPSHTEHHSSLFPQTSQ